MAGKSNHGVQIKRAYEKAEKSDGVRILVDRIWPRGVKKEAAALDEWLKELAPPTELRKWFGHDPKKWPEFRKRYQNFLKESEEAGEALEKIRERLKSKKVTLVFAAKDEEHNNAVVLAELLQRGKGSVQNS